MHEVHVWRAGLDLTDSRVRNLERTLAADERSRAERFYFRKDRDRYVVGRGLLRTILGLYLNQKPDELQFAYSSHGKPALAGELGGEALRFNLSHSHGLALYAITRGREVGVDLELIRSDFADEQIAERFFSPEEVAALRALPASVRTRAFFTCWTRKEAYIKARGEGLSIPLDQFNVSIVPGEPAVLSSRSDPRETARWSLQELALTSDYAAALAVEGRDWKLRCWQWFEARV